MISSKLPENCKFIIFTVLNCLEFVSRIIRGNVKQHFQTFLVFSVCLLQMFFGNSAESRTFAKFGDKIKQPKVIASSIV